MYGQIGQTKLTSMEGWMERETHRQTDRQYGRDIGSGKNRCKTQTKYPF